MSELGCTVNDLRNEIADLRIKFATSRKENEQLREMIRMYKEIPLPKTGPETQLVFLQQVSDMRRKRFALLVGIGKAYSRSELANPANDCNDLSEKLISFGFIVQAILEKDVTHENIRYHVELILEMAKKARIDPKEPAPAILFFFSGHGCVVDNKEYICTFDGQAANAPDKARFKTSNICVQGVAKKLSRGNIDGVNFVMIDACRSDAGYRGGDGSEAAGAGLKPADGTCIVFACQAGKVAYDGEPGKNGLLTGSLIAALSKPRTVGLHHRDVLQDVKQGVHKQYPSQRVVVYDDILGDFIFRPHDAVKLVSERMQIEDFADPKSAWSEFTQGFKVVKSSSTGKL